MPFITWEEKYSVGVRQFNEEHQKLIGMINDLHDAMKAGKSKDVMGGILDRLAAYTRTHFAAEEQAFARHGYPEAAAQKAQHEALLAKVADFQKGFKEGKVLVSMELMNFLQDWLLKHICGEDRKYGPFLNAKGMR